MSATARVRLYNALLLVAAFAGLAFAMFPGRFNGDAIGQYQQGLTWVFDDSHSVMTAALMGALADLGKGPGPMFLVQLGLWIGGLLLLTDTLIASGRPRVGQAISLLSLLPLLTFDFFDVQSDALFSGCLAVLVALGVRALIRKPAPTVIGAVAAFAFLVFALDVRMNGVFALMAIFLLFTPLTRLKARAAAACAAIALLVFAAAGIAQRWFDDGVLKTHRSHLVYALQIYDLAGVTARTGQDASHGAFPDFRAQAARCYSPHEWDAFLGGACRPVGLQAQAYMEDPVSRGAMTRIWLMGIARHPVAYLAHRAANFGCLVRIGCRDVVQDMSSGWSPRPWDEPNMRVTAGARVLGAAAHALWRGPLGSGVLWILALAAELAAGAWSLRKRGFAAEPYLAVVLAAAGLLYIGSFALFGVADQLRYLHPAIFLALMAAPLTAVCLHQVFARTAEPAPVGEGAPPQLVAAPAGAKRVPARLLRRRA